jgi:hypothetical protein
MNLSAHPVFASLFWYEKATLLFALFYPVLGVLMARRRLASGQGSVVALSTLPLTAAAVIFLLGLAPVGDDLRMYSTSQTTVAGLRAPLRPLFMACLSTLLVLAGSFPRRTGGGERPRSTGVTWIVTGAPFVVVAGGFAYGLVLSPWSMSPGSLASSALGVALIGLHLLAVNLRVPPESRATVAAVFVLTILLAWATWRLGHSFWVEE